MTSELSQGAGRRRVRWSRGVVVAGLALAVVGGIATVAGLGGRRTGTGRSAAASLLATAPPTPLGRSIAALQARLGAQPADWRGWAELGGLAVEQARASSDPSWYPRAQGALERSTRLHPTDNVGALVGAGALANARHHFSDGRRAAEKAIAIAPDTAAVYGVEADSLIELGRYREGFSAVQHMVDLRPGLASYARVSYARELQGDGAGAATALDAAVATASTQADAAFATFLLGELSWNAGRADEAVERYERAARLDPTSVQVQAALARAHAWAGRGEQAMADYARVVERAPTIQYLAEYGDLATMLGRPDVAEGQRSLIDVERRLFGANGVDTDLELSLYDADHGRAPRALAEAEAEYGRRHSVLVADALGWALHAVGRDGEALVRAEEALRLGTSSAPLLYHRGMIEKALHHEGDADRDLHAALAINPRFSFLEAAKARAALAGAT